MTDSQPRNANRITTFKHSVKTVALNYSRENQSLMVKRQKENRSEPTPAEAHVIGLLDTMGERYVFEKGLFTAHKFFLVDFYFPKPRKLCLEIDGAYHDSPAQKAKDKTRDKFIRTKRKMKVKRITNDHALSLTAQQLFNLIS